MKINWRPPNWENPYDVKVNVDNELIPNCRIYERVFEDGADALFDALFELAKQSPTGTFIIDSKVQNIYKER